MWLHKALENGKLIEASCKKPTSVMLLERYSLGRILSSTIYHPVHNIEHCAVCETMVIEYSKEKVTQLLRSHRGAGRGMRGNCFLVCHLFLLSPLRSAPGSLEASHFLAQRGFDHDDDEDVVVSHPR